MGAQLRGAQDVEVGVPGSSGVDQAERPNNVGYSRPCGSVMGDSGVLGCPCSPQPQSLALAACGGKVVCSGCSAWQSGTFPAPSVLQPPHEVHVTLRLPRMRSGKALGGLWSTRTGWHRMVPVGPTYRSHLGQQCACERSSWTLSHVCMMIVNADLHMCRRDHLVPCCPLHGCCGRCVPGTVGANRKLIGWSSATVMARISARTAAWSGL